MKRWDAVNMRYIGEKLFAKIHRRKKHANENHEVHYMAREIDDWLPDGIESLIRGNYDPRLLKQYNFADETVIQPHLSDRVFQHILLKQLKHTFKYIVNPNCYHLYGPSGVKYATTRVRDAIEKDKPAYVIRADIKSFYSSIPHYKLIQDIKNIYRDPKVVRMLSNIIRNPIDAPRGIKNPDFGIALRGPLSQLFSAIYLKPLDDAFNNMGVTYVRFQDDVLLLCKTRRQMNRARRKMMQVLDERRLRLSRKKSRMGSIENGFHFLGTQYPPTQTESNIAIKNRTFDAKATNNSDSKLNWGGVKRLLISACAINYE